MERRGRGRSAGAIEKLRWKSCAMSGPQIGLSENEDSTSSLHERRKSYTHYIIMLVISFNQGLFGWNLGISSCTPLHKH